ncbi:MAG: PD-(D/E)XK nuclease family protein [Anaerolineales bacterium]|nr:PD-(D/E)XK nuclease family protein [Anaerolineales bacterium]
MRTIKHFPFTSILGWSATRYDLFSICKRKYFYHYYAKYDLEIRARQLTRFKELVTIPLETGGIVHEVIEALLNRLKATAADIDRPRFHAFADRLVEQHLQDRSFDEVVYGELPAVRGEDLSPKIHACLDNLLASERFAWLVEEAVASAADWIIDPDGYGETRLQEMKVYCKVDFLFPLGDELHIVDWKTGKSDPAKHRKQLLGYATWAAYHFETDPARIQPTIAYLHPAYEEVHEDFSATDLDNFAVQVRAETNEMYAYCREIVQNIPLDKPSFPQVDDDRICAYCSFRGACYPERFPAHL